MNEPVSTPTPMPEAPKKNNMPMIIGGIVVVLCCCCLVIGIVGYQFGDQILKALGQ